VIDIDIEPLRGWIGSSEIGTDRITPGLVERFGATLGLDEGGRNDGDPAPPAIHWCLAQPAVATAMLGGDGHPARGGFLPPVPLARRMWAGGSLSFHDDLRIGDSVTRRSKVADVTAKAGRSGPLVFVTIVHEIETARGLAISERQDIVYRQPSPPGATAAPPAASAPPREADFSQAMDATSVLLFRYSALTFNSHRIHYDADYARKVEGYPGLVVHGPLQATLLLNLAVRLGGGWLPARFDYRGLAPLFAGQRFTINAIGSGAELELWTADAGGAIAMSAKAWAGGLAEEDGQ
jgi:3-methylfumaryl-CoA hydratase